MFYLKDNRICVGGISFELPNKMSLCGEKTNKNQIVFAGENDNYIIFIRTKNGCIPNPKKINKKIIKNDVSPIAELSMNGLWGIYVTYKSIKSELYKAWLRNTSPKSGYIEITIYTNKNTSNIKDVLSREEMVSFFCSLRAE